MARPRSAKGRSTGSALLLDAGLALDLDLHARSTSFFTPTSVEAGRLSPKYAMRHGLVFGRSVILVVFLLVCHPMCGGSHMATNLSIDPDLIERALEVSGERTKKAAVTKALQEFIARRRQKRLLDLIGKLEWDSSYDYKAERAHD
jgi:Arc/MetJ family transcription regulator